MAIEISLPRFGCEKAPQLLLRVEEETLSTEGLRRKPEQRGEHMGWRRGPEVVLIT